MQIKQTYFGFAVADSMFPTNCIIKRRSLEVDEFRTLIDSGVQPCINPTHKATIDAMRRRFGINIPIPEKPIQVDLQLGDSIIIMGVRGLERLTDRRHYTDKEIEEASFSFSIYTIEEL